ncbi:MAG: alpha/beta hydrolase [Thermomicrobium sp.]|nr:alpha/beta hydrolase [Thermomicrobium sp.]MDW8060889.1 alpha/beta hydrolase [Thermomicrobium sp.]
MATPVQPRFLPLEGLQLFVLEAGDDRLPLLVLHGFASSALAWTEVIAALAEERRVVAYDRPGFGLSRVKGSWRGEDPFAPGAQVGIALALLDRLGLERVAVLGHSLGGRLAYELAVSAPERIAGAALVAPAWDRPSRPVLGRLLGRRPVSALGRAVLRLAAPAAFRLAERRLWASAPPASSRARARELWAVPGWDEGLWRSTVATLASPPSPAPDAAPPVPTLVVLGERDRIVANRRTLALVERWRAAEAVLRVERFAASGHLPHVEEFARFVQVVRHFLEEVEDATPAARGTRTRMGGDDDRRETHR